MNLSVSSGMSGYKNFFAPILAFFALIFLAYLTFALPSVTYVSPTLLDNATTGSNWVYVNVTSSENLNQSLLEWGNSTGFTNVSMSNLSASMQNWYINMTGLADSSYNYTVWAENTTGNWSQTARRWVAVDTISPNILFSAADGNNTFVSRNWSFVNVSFSDATSPDLTAFIDWNSSLIGWWRFNNETGESSALFRDWSTYGNNVSCFAENCSSLTSGKFGSGLQFDGANDYLRINASSNFRPTTEMTIEAWFMQQSSNTYVLVGKYNSTYKEYSLAWDNTNKRLSGSVSSNGAAWITVQYNTTLQNNTWYHIAYTVNSSESSLYLNGTLVNTTTGAASIYSTANPASIGAYIGSGTSNSNNFNGTIDEVRIWKRALSPEEISASYDAGQYRIAHNFTNLGEGEYAYTTYAEDLAGNVNQVGRIVTVYIEPNFSVNLIAPDNAYFTSKLNISMNFTTTSRRADTCLYSIDDGLNYTMQSCQNTTFSALRDGNHTIKVYVTNVIGVTNVSEAANFSVNTNSSWLNEGIIYETGIEYYPNQTFNDLKERLPELKELGVTVIELFPIWNYTTGSYSIVDYYAINHTYGNATDLKNLVNETHKNGMKLILDLVTGYVPSTSVIFTTHPEWLVHDNDQNILGCSNISYSGPSNEIIICNGNVVAANISGSLVLTNYPHYDWGWAPDRANPEVISYFSNISKYYIQEYGIDGWRVDAPQNNYNPSIAEGHHDGVNFYRGIKQAMLEANQNTVLYGEYPGPTCESDTRCDPWFDEMFEASYNYPFSGWLRTDSTPPTSAQYGSLGDAGYRTFCNSADFYYHSGFLESVVKNTNTSQELVDFLNRQNVLYGALRSTFIESYSGAFRIQCAFPEQETALLALEITLPGTPSIFVGQENGALPHRAITSLNWAGANQTIWSAYKKLFEIRKNDSALIYGNLSNAWVEGNKSFAYRRAYGENSTLIVLNFYNQSINSQVNISFGAAVLPNVTYILQDILNGEFLGSYGRALENASVSLQAYGARIFRFVPINSSAIKKLNLTAVGRNMSFNENATITIHKGSSILDDYGAIDSLKNYSEFEFESGAIVSVKYIFPLQGRSASLDIRDINLTENLTLAPQIIENYAGQLISSTTSKSPVIAFNDTNISYGGAEITFTLSGTANRILHCTNWSYSDAICSDWELNATSAYNGTYNSSHFVFNVTSFDAYMAGEYATCSDGTQNQGETGTDCGGPCSACQTGGNTGGTSGGGTAPVKQNKTNQTQQNINVTIPNAIENITNITINSKPEVKQDENKTTSGAREKVSRTSSYFVYAIAALILAVAVYGLRSGLLLKSSKENVVKKSSGELKEAKAAPRAIRPKEEYMSMLPKRPQNKGSDLDDIQRRLEEIKRKMRDESDRCVKYAK